MVDAERRIRGPNSLSQNERSSIDRQGRVQLGPRHPAVRRHAHREAGCWSAFALVDHGEEGGVLQEVAMIGAGYQRSPKRLRRAFNWTR
jgi:hypothetical protein